MSKSNEPPVIQSSSLLNIRETAAVLRLSVSTIRSWVLNRRIPFVKLGKAIRFRRVDVDAFIAASVVSAEVSA